MATTDKTNITYNGPALPGNAEEIILFSSTVAWGPRAAPHYTCYTFFTTIRASLAAGTQTVRLEVSFDGGSTWFTVGTPTAVSAGVNTKTFNVHEYQDFRVVYLNGTSVQTGFGVAMAISHGL